MKYLILSAFLITAPLPAQTYELGLFVGQQAYHKSDFTPLPSDSRSRLVSQVDSRTVTALRLGYCLVDLGRGSLQITSGYQPETRASVHTSAPNIPQDLGRSNLTESYWSVGTMFNFNWLISTGLGVEYRMEKLRGGPTGNFSYDRPWARMNIGYVFPTHMVKPFISLEAALPLSTKSNETGTNAETAIQAIAPKWQIGVYAGIRF